MANEYRISGLQAEVVVANDAQARISGLQAEAVVSYNSDARLHSITVEVVRSIELIRRRNPLMQVTP